jgi:flagellar biogenesis protein FliO
MPRFPAAAHFGTAIALLPPKCRESVVRQKKSRLAGTLLGALLTVLLGLGLGRPAWAQAPPPSPSEKELQAPLALDDGKPTPGNATPAESGPSAWRAVGSLLLVSGLAGGGLWAFRRWGARRLPGSGGGRMKVEETLALGDRRFVSILKVDEERFLIALGPQGVNLMTRLDNVEAGGPARFEEALGRQVQITTPMPVREMEAMLQRERQP